MFKEIIETFGVTASNATGLVKGLNGGIVSEDPGMRLISYVALGLCLLTIVLIVYKIIFLRRDASIGITTRWIFLITFIILSPLTYFISFGIGIEKSKPVEFCNSCHIMNSHVDDMKDPDSESIASLHYKYRWISDDQCYTCHSDYGLYGAVGAKFAGVRHILNYYVMGYPKTLEIRGTYNNERCLFCHAPVESYQDIEEHQEYAAEIKSSEQSCFGADCHVSPHPDETKEIEDTRRTK
jgi:nitrate/TMAO reductase-like tetraheme cytochrome c subunit